MGKCEYDRRGVDVPDDCPYPDIPSNGAHCEDATPFMCQNERFRKKCCQSCNKDFTEEEACKDTHMIINRMTCAQLTQTMLGKFACKTDEKVQNYCCRSCKNIQGSLGGFGEGLIVKSAVTTRTPNSITNRNPFSASVRSNTIVHSNGRRINRTSKWRSLPPRVISRSQRLISRSAVPSRIRSWNSAQPEAGPRSRNSAQPEAGPRSWNSAQPEAGPTYGACQDSKRIRINKLTCPELIAKEGYRMCFSPQVKSICCYTCSKYLK